MVKKRKTRRAHKLKSGTVVVVKAPFDHRPWLGKVVGEQGPPAHEIVRLLIEPARGGASLWRKPSELKAVD